MYKQVLDFWFKEIEPELWWKKDSTLDSLIENKFGALHKKAVLGELFSWRKKALSSLAEIIILDQFSRNIYRDQAQAFSSDFLALALSQSVIEKGFDKELASIERSFVYMPFMHSESLLIHEEAIRLFSDLGNKTNLEFELKHKAIIEKFGRYPHRNKILGRKSSKDELAFLKSPNSSF